MSKSGGRFLQFFVGAPIENLNFNNQTIDYRSVKVTLVREVIGCNDSTSWILLLICRMKCWASNQLRRNSWILRRDNYYCFLEETKGFFGFSFEPKILYSYILCLFYRQHWKDVEYTEINKFMLSKKPGVLLFFAGIPVEILKVSKSRKKNSQFFQKTNETREKIILRALRIVRLFAFWKNW